MAEHDLNWKYVNEIVVEDDVITAARQRSLELGVTPVTPAIGAQIGAFAAAIQAKSIVEIGTGVGVSGLWLLQSARQATLTSIDIVSDRLEQARQHFNDAKISQARTRLITGNAIEVLPRLNDSSYDLVVVDADPHGVIEYVENGLRLARPGGTVLVTRALWRGKVADPAKRDEFTTSFRTLINELSDSPAVITALSPAGDGLLQVVKLGE